MQPIISGRNCDSNIEIFFGVVLCFFGGEDDGGGGVRYWMVWGWKEFWWSVLWLELGKYITLPSHHHYNSLNIQFNIQSENKWKCIFFTGYLFCVKIVYTFFCYWDTKRKRQRELWADRQTNRKKDKQTETERQTGRQPEVKQTETNRKTYRQRDKQTEIGRPKTNWRQEDRNKQTDIQKSSII